MLGNYRILHISDLHFGETHAKVHRSSLRLAGRVRSRVNIPVSKLILDELPGLERERAETIVICSGDIANYDQPKDFSKAVSFFNTLKREYHIPAGQILLVPGNHDVYWQDYSGRDPSKMLDLFQRRFRNFANPLKSGDGPCYYFAKQRLLVYLLNSCLLCGAREEIPGLIELLGHIGPRRARLEKLEIMRKLVQIDPGFLGRDQVMTIQTNTQEKLSGIEEDERKLIVKVAVLHHHVNPLFPELQRFASVLDAAPLKEMLWWQGFHIILHGHKHQPHYCRDATFMDRSEGALSVLSSGTMGGEPLIGEYYSFNVLDVVNYASRIARVNVKRIEYGADGLPKSPPAERWRLNLKDQAAIASERPINSLINSLSAELPVSLAKAMFELHKTYKHHNPVEVKRYDVKYRIRPDYSSGIGSHQACHVIGFSNRSASKLRRFVLSLAGSYSVDYDHLRVLARYKFGRGSWQTFGDPTIYCDHGCIKIVGYDFTGAGLLPGRSAAVEVKYTWPNTVPFGQSEWGIENWMFRYGIQTASIECSIQGPSQISRAQAYSVEYDDDNTVYECRQEEVLGIARTGVPVRWEKKLAGKTKTIHAVRITLKR
jgi:hypothetical protein